MHSNHLLLEEPIRMASILEPAKAVSQCVCGGLRFCIDLCICMILIFAWIIRLQNFFPAMAKIVGTLGPRSRSVDVISACLQAGMSGNRIIFLFFLFLNFFFMFWDYCSDFYGVDTLSLCGSGEIWFFVGWCRLSSGNSGKFEDCD